MSTIAVVFERTQSNDIHNIQNRTLDSQELPKGVELIANTAYTMEFPRHALFFAKLLTVLEGGHYNFHVFETVSPKD